MTKAERENWIINLEDVSSQIDATTYVELSFDYNSITI